MVRVLEKKEQKRYKIRCENCESLLEYTKLDEKFESYYDSTDFYIVCPVCKKKVYTKIYNSDETCFYGKEAES